MRKKKPRTCCSVSKCHNCGKQIRGWRLLGPRGHTYHAHPSCKNVYNRRL